MFAAFVLPLRGFEIENNAYPPLTQWATIVLPLTGEESAHCPDNPVRVLNPDRVSALWRVGELLQTNHG